MNGVDSGPKPGSPQLDKDGMLVVPEFDTSGGGDQTPGPRYVYPEGNGPLPPQRDSVRAEAEARQAVDAAARRERVSFDATGYNAGADGYTPTRGTAPGPGESYKKAYGIKDDAQAEPAKPTGLRDRARAFVSKFRSGGQPRG